MPWPAADPLVIVMGAQPRAASQVNLPSVAYAMPIQDSGLLLLIRSPSGALGSSTRTADPFQVKASWLPSAAQRRTDPVNCREPGVTFSAVSSPDAVVDQSRSSAPVATE